jgi:hypothetical protein
MSVSLADHDHRVRVGRGDGDPRLSGRGGQSRCGGDGGAGGDRAGRPGGGAAAAPGPSIDFLREEVADICGALALGGSLLRRLGLGAEAVRLESLYGAVAARLAEAQLSAAPSLSLS